MSPSRESVMELISKHKEGALGIQSFRILTRFAEQINYRTKYSLVEGIVTISDREVARGYFVIEAKSGTTAFIVKLDMSIAELTTCILGSPKLDDLWEKSWFNTKLKGYILSSMEINYGDSENF